MASPAEIMDRWARKSRPAAANDEPDGFISVNGEPMAVFLPNGETAVTLKLSTFSANRRWGRQ